MAYALAGTGHIAAGATDTFKAETAGLDTTSATLIVIAVSAYESSHVLFPPADSKSNTWTALTKSALNNGATQLFYCVSPTVGAGHTFKSDGGATPTYPAICVLAFTGNSATPADQENENTDVNSTIAPGSITPSEDNELIISCLYYGVPGGSTIDSSFIQLDDIDNVPGSYVGGSMAYKIQTTAVAVNPTWTMAGGSATTISRIASFKAAVSSAGGPLTNNGSLVKGSIIDGGRLIG